MKSELREGIPKQGQLVRVFPKEGGASFQAKYFGITYHSVENGSRKCNQEDIRGWMDAPESPNQEQGFPASD